MNPRGPIPHAVALMDDQLFDSQCLADATQALVEHVQEDLAGFWRDREIDLPEARHMAKDLGRLHSFTKEQSTLLRTIRDCCNRIIELVRRLRARIQDMKKAARCGTAIAEEG